MSAALACIGEPISWLRLETFAAGRDDHAIARPTNVGRAAPPEGVRRSIASPTNVGRAALPEGVRRSIGSPTNVGRAALPEGVRRSIADHVAACPACKACLEEIRADLVALPPLVVPVRAPVRAWWKLAVPAFAVAAAAVIALVVWRGGDDAPRAVREDAVSIKGIGEVVLGTVRERRGTIREDARSFATGDRWKLVVTCPPSAAGAPLAVDVTVVEIGGTAGADRPLVPAQIACGNRVVLPGAFSLTGPRANRVCATIGPDRQDDRSTACVTIAPE